MGDASYKAGLIFEEPDIQDNEEPDIQDNEEPDIQDNDISPTEITTFLYP